MESSTKLGKTIHVVRESYQLDGILQKEYQTEILEMKNLIDQIGNTFDNLRNSIDQTEGRISESEERYLGIFPESWDINRCLGSADPRMKLDRKKSPSMLTMAGRSEVKK